MLRDEGEDSGRHHRDRGRVSGQNPGGKGESAKLIRELRRALWLNNLKIMWREDKRLFFMVVSMPVVIVFSMGLMLLLFYYRFQLTHRALAWFILFLFGIFAAPYTINRGLSIRRITRTWTPDTMLSLSLLDMDEVYRLNMRRTLFEIAALAIPLTVMLFAIGIPLYETAVYLILFFAVNLIFLKTGMILRTRMGESLFLHRSEEIRRRRHSAHAPQRRGMSESGMGWEAVNNAFHAMMRRERRLRMLNYMLLSLFVIIAPGIYLDPGSAGIYVFFLFTLVLAYLLSLYSILIFVHPFGPGAPVRANLHEHFSGYLTMDILYLLPFPAPEVVKRMYLFHLKLLSAMVVILLAPSAGYLFLSAPEKAAAIFAPSLLILIAMSVLSFPAFFVYISCAGMHDINLIKPAVPWKVPTIIISVIFLYLFYMTTALMVPLLDVQVCYLTFASSTAGIAALTALFYRRSIMLYDTISIMR